MAANTLPDDILWSLFPYLNSHDLCAASHTCHQWRSVATKDELWRSLAEKRLIDLDNQLDDGQLFKHYIQLCRYGSQKKSLHRVKIWNISALSLFLFCLLVASLTYSIIIPLVLDKIVTSQWITLIVTSLPLLVFVILPLLLLIWTMIYARYVVSSVTETSSARKHGNYENLENGYYSHSEVVHQESNRSRLVGIIVVSLMCIPIIGLLVCTRLIGLNSIPYTVLFAPFYGYTMGYLVVIPCYYLYLSSQHGYKFKYLIACIAGSLFQIYVATQVGLIGAKLDHIIYTPWSVVFIPSWIVFGIITMITLCMRLISSIALFCLNRYGVQYDEEMQDNIHFVAYLTGIVVMVLLVPVMVWLILLCMRLDGGFITAMNSFIPLIVLEGCAIFSIVTLVTLRTITRCRMNSNKI
jgi:hypothetical protein